MKPSWLLVLGAAAVLALPARADGWKLALGASYRSFDEVSFSPLQLSSSGGAFVNGYYNSDSDYRVEGVDQLDLAGWLPLGPVFTRGVTFDQTTYAGSSDGFGGTAGTVITLSRQIRATESGWTFGANFSLGWFSSDLSATATEGNGLSTTTYGGVLIFPFDPGLAVPAAPFSDSPGLTMNGPTTGSTTTALVRLDADLDLYVLSLGMSASRSLGPLSIRLEAGPTVNLADFDTSVTQEVRWSSNGNDVYVPRPQTDDTLDILFGVYASGGVSWRLTERWEVGIEARWDEVFDDVSTDLAHLELSGVSLSAQVGFSF